MKILSINSSVQSDASVSRKLVKELTDKLSKGQYEHIERDLAKGVPLLTQEMVEAFYTAPDQRNEEQNNLIKISEELVHELQQADHIIIGFPIYNFSVPGSVKAYFDLVARVGVTFSYGENGPVGLLKNKKAYVVVASGGIGFRSEVDFASDYTRHFLGFIGISDVTFVPADKLMSDADASLKNARSIIEKIGEKSNVGLSN